MKEILIRLEDELYEQCKTTELTEENEGFDFHIIKSVANGTPLSEEIKKIKAEIKVNARGEYDFEGYCREEKISIKEVNKIIDKHIAELKGE